MDMDDTLYGLQRTTSVRLDYMVPVLETMSSTPPLDHSELDIDHVRRPCGL